MSISYRVLNSELKIESVLNTLIAIGVEIEYVNEGDEYDYYVIGNDEYGYTRMYVEDNLVTEFHKFGIGRRPIDMMFRCFDFIAYVTNDHDGGEFDDDLEWLPDCEFFKKHYPLEHEIRMNMREVEDYVEKVDPELFTYVRSIDRTVASYRYEYAFIKRVPVSEVSLDEVITYIHEQVIASEKRSSK